MSGVGFEFRILIPKMNYPAASCEVSEEGDENYPKGVTPECFYRGSTSSDFRLDSRLKHAGMTVFEKKISLTQQTAAN